MKFKLENIKMNISEEVQFELGKIEVQYTLEEMVQMHSSLKDVIDTVVKLSNIDNKEEPETKDEPNKQMDEVFANFADIFSKEKQDV
tara:strand:+ start:11273 stop:11533 length:261 start_codon:yes stop_codon:yes gene_type:complete